MDAIKSVTTPQVDLLTLREALAEEPPVHSPQSAPVTPASAAEVATASKQVAFREDGKSPPRLERPPLNRQAHKRTQTPWKAPAKKVPAPKAEAPKTEKKD